ncbi:MAG: ABC transporter ATP-binding protein/permease [Dehalococcoidia bacterium]|nr:ABC transporter ATP-binding protein/permease [Dehalococcoidia bacterium]
MKKERFINDAAVYVLKSNWWLAALLLLTIIASMAIQLIPAFIIRQIIDEHFAKGIVQGIWLLAIWYLAVQAGVNVVAFVKTVVTTVLGQKILNRIRMLMAQRLSKLPIQYFTNTPVGEIMSRLTTDVDAINTLFSSGIIGMATDLFKIVGLLVSLFIIAPQLIWLEITIVPLIFLISNYYRKNIFRFQKLVRSKVADIYSFIQEWLRGIHTVKAYSLEENGKQRFREPLESHFAAIGKISLYDSLFPCLMQTIRAVVIALALWFGAKNGTFLSLALSTGTLAAIADLVGRIFAPIEALAQEFQTIQQAMAGISRVNEFASEPIEDRVYIDQPIDKSQGLVIDGVTFSYGSVPVLHALHARLMPGEKAVFIGRSGAGKTTLMNIVAGLYRPKEGFVRICGVDPYTIPPRKRRRLLGIVPQMPQIFDGTVTENITLGDETISQEEVEAAVKAVGLGETINALPQGFATVIGEGAAGLSSGETQLLSLARAIVANPQILLLDEPTSGMDSKTEQRVFSAIRTAGTGRTIFSISHRLSGIIDADRVFVMAGGNIVKSGSSEELYENDDWYAMYQKTINAGWDLS